MRVLNTIFILLIFLFSSCDKKSETSNQSPKNEQSPKFNYQAHLESISIGMKPEEVIAKIGKPPDMKLGKNDDAWVYHGNHDDLKEGFNYSGIQIHFKDGVVSKVIPTMVNQRTYGIPPKK